MGMSFADGPPKDKQEMTALLRTAIDRGITFFDTAEVYGPYINEELFGEALAPYMGQVVIATSSDSSFIPTASAVGRASTAGPITSKKWPRLP